MLKHIRWDDVEREELNPYMERQLATGEGIMVARIRFRKGAAVPEHGHHNEQVTNVLAGSLKFWIDGRELILGSGEVLCIPPHMPHKVVALEDSLVLDTFTPPRQDWLDGSDSYLRQAAPEPEVA